MVGLERGGLVRAMQEIPKNKKNSAILYEQSNQGTVFALYRLIAPQRCRVIHQPVILNG